MPHLLVAQMDVATAAAIAEDTECPQVLKARSAPPTVWYNYVKQHKTLKGLSPAMPGIRDTLRSTTDLAEVIDAAAPKPGKRGPYKKQVA